MSSMAKDNFVQELALFMFELHMKGYLGPGEGLECLEIAHWHTGCRPCLGLGVCVRAWTVTSVFLYSSLCHQRELASPSGRN